LVDKKASDFVLSWTCVQKLLLAGSGVLLKKRCGNVVPIPNKERLIGLLEFLHWIFLFHFSAMVLCTR